jgi:hypothetical protein
MGKVKKFEEFVNESVSTKSIKEWGDDIIKMLHNNNDEKIHGLFRSFAREISDMSEEESTNKFKELTDYIKSSVDSPSIFSDKTAEHFKKLYLKK